MATRAQLLELLERTRRNLETYQPTYRVVIRDPAGVERVLYSAQPKQDLLHIARAPNVLYGGAAGGGKSHGIRWDAIVKCLRVPGLKVLILRRTFPELEKTHLLSLPEEVPPELAEWREGKRRLIVRHRTGAPAVIQFGHCKDLKAVTQYLSTEWDLIYLDEAQTFLPAQVRLLRSRLRTKNPSIRPQLIMGANPGGELHGWLEAHFMSKDPDPEDSPGYRPADYQFIPALVTDNAKLDAAYIDRLLELPELEQRAYLYGDWTAFAGKFFREWDPAVHVIEGLDGLPTDSNGEVLPLWMEREGGMDWGYDPDPVVVEVAAFDSTGRGWLYREVTLYRTSPEEVAVAIDAALPEGRFVPIILRGDTQMWIAQPHNGVSIAETINDKLADLGSKVYLERANKDRVNGWQRLRQRLDPRRQAPDGLGPMMRVLAPGPSHEWGCPYLIKAMPVQSFDDRDSRRGDMKASRTDHPLDAVRYLFMGRTPITSLPLEERPVVPHHRRVHQKSRQMLERLQRMADAEEEASRGVLTLGEDEGQPLDGALEADDDTLEGFY